MLKCIHVLLCTTVSHPANPLLQPVHFRYLSFSLFPHQPVVRTGEKRDMAGRSCEEERGQRSCEKNESKFNFRSLEVTLKDFIDINVTIDRRVDYSHPSSFPSLCEA